MPYAIPYEEDDDDEGILVHSEGGSFCADASCPCHEDAELIAELACDVESGLLSPDEATSIVNGTYRAS